MQGVALERSRNPLVRQFAIGILNQFGTRSQDYYSEAVAIGRYVQKNVAYVKDPTQLELLVDPVTLLEQVSRKQARGDCDDMSLLIATLLLSIGHEPYFRCVRYEGRIAGAFSHIYVVDKFSDGSYVSLDAIVKGEPIGFEVPHSSQVDYPCIP